MKNVFALGLILLFPFSILAQEIDSKTVDHIQAVSVTVETSHGSGSGVIKTRSVNNIDTAYVFTAGHVVEGLRKTREVIDGRTGTSRTIVEFDDPRVVRVLIEDGRTVGKLEMFSRVVRYSKEEDLAILQIRKKNFIKDGVKFYLEDKPLTLGTTVYHCGSLLGEMGSNSLTVGIISQNGRLVEDKTFTQITATGFPGSSGGPVFLKDGRLVGQVLRGAGENFVLMAPVDRIVKWAKDSGMGFTVDDNIAVPSEVDLKKIPIEDNGVVFPASPQEKTAPHSIQTKKMFWENSNNGKNNLLLRSLQFIVW